MDTSYLKLLDGARVKNHMGLRMDEGFEWSKGKNYLHMDVPAREVLELKRGQHVFLESAATVNVRGRNFIEVEPNPALAEYGQVQGIYRIHPDSGEKRLGVWITLHKNLETSGLEYLVRVYMPA